jgi:hypothetical protein
MSAVEDELAAQSSADQVTRIAPLFYCNIRFVRRGEKLPRNTGLAAFKQQDSRSRKKKHLQVLPMRRRNGFDLSSSDCLELTAGVGDQSNSGHQRLGDDVDILHSDQQVVRSVPDAL